MGQGKDLYEENKCLRRELDDANNRYFEKRDAENDRREAILELALTAIETFLQGKSSFVIEPGGNIEGTKYVRFVADERIV